jgi:cytochrome c-type biogenesis protein CcmH
MSIRLFALLLLALAFAAPAAASELHPTLPELEHEVMCPTCHTLLELSHAPVAERMRVFIRARIAHGETKSEITSQLVGEFGEGVLAAPPTRGFGLLAWLLPIAGLLAAAAVVAIVARHWRRLAVRDDASGAHGRLAPALERALDEELARYDA